MKCFPRVNFTSLVLDKLQPERVWYLHLERLPALVSAASYLQSNTKNTNMAYSILFHFAQQNRKHFYYKGEK